MELGTVAPVWVPLIVYVVMLGVAALGFIAVDVLGTRSCVRT